MSTRYKSYMICTSPRSGSTLLCRLLAATGVAGHPDSHFHRPSLEAWQKSFGLSQGRNEPESLQAVFASAIHKGRGETGIFGLRMQRPSFAFFLEKLGVLYPGMDSDRARIEQAFGRTLFIHLTREDKVAQAVSYVKARQSGLWHVAPDGSDIERTAPFRKPDYDSTAIGEWYTSMLTFDRDWTAWFERQGVKPLTLTYDALSQAPQATLASVLTELGRDPALADTLQTPTQKMADAHSDAWVRRFRAEIERDQLTA
ncbi:sulfotransferase [Martelella lutilitoris]|uniref:Sulfotransferase n=1 Tax=Martelella lutilitoris TaxID=2583532 RepID=A0A5C4JQM4_9HYPH|nr:Stf0 family sulfotransferase [Martelella lutilitoris]TNB47444.1 sulfotransferase [Martelella lutilitoris]